MAVTSTTLLGSADSLFGGIPNPFATPTFRSVQEAGGGTTTATDASGNVTTLPTFVVQEPKFTGGELGNIFNPNQITGADYIGFNTELSGATPGISPGTGIGALGGGPTSTVKVGDTNQTVSFDDIVNKEIQAEIERMRNEGVFSSDPEFGTRIEVAANRGLEIYNAAAGPSRSLDLSSSGGAVAGQGGIPLILPIPGIDPSTAAILTAAGLIFSGGKIARLDPNNPVGSVAGAVQGVGQTGQNVINVATGKDTLGNIWDPGSTGAPSGSTSAGTGATGGAGGDVGGGTAGNVGGAIFGGGLSTGGGAGAAATGATAGMGQQTTGGGAVAVTGGALGGQPGGTAAPGSTTGSGATKGAGEMPSTGGPYIFDSSERTQNILGQILAPSQAINQAAAVAAAEEQQKNVINQTLSTAGAAQTGAGTTSGGMGGTGGDVGGGATGVGVVGTGSGGGGAGGINTGTGGTNPSGGGGDTTGGGTTGVVPGGGDGGGTKVSGGGTGTASGGTTSTGTGDVAPNTGTPGAISTGGTVPTTTGTSASTPIVINAPTVGYTLPTQGTPAARNLYTEAGTTLASLAAPMRQFQIGVDAQGKPIYGTATGAGGQPLSLSEAIAQGYGGLSQGMTGQDIQNLLNSIRAQTGTTVTPGQAGGYQSALTQAANEQTAAANTALRSGNIADAEALFSRAQSLRQQANPQLYGDTGTLGQYATAAQNQVARDIAALRQAETGQLTPEQIRNAQQSAREAYAARGQVFSQGAAAQEVLNRQAAIQQREQLARQNLAQSMGQLGQGVAYQTANIFDPMAATLGAQYGMQSQNVGLNQALYNQAMGLTSGAGGYGFAQQMINPFSGYAQDVYGTNVNALNAAQIAAANRQAALEAAKMGQTGTYAQAAGNLIASGGLGQIQSGITGGIQGLLSLLGGKWPTS